MGPWDCLGQKSLQSEEWNFVSNWKASFQFFASALIITRQTLLLLPIIPVGGLPF
jgi:hypothetical protein